MPLGLNGKLLQALVESCGGRDAFVSQWLSSATKPGDTFDKQTLSRWIRGESRPQTSYRMLRLAHLLDVDPFALLAPSDGEFAKTADRVINFIQNRYTAHESLDFLAPFFGRVKTWPPPFKDPKRKWVQREFEHKAVHGTGHYALVSIKGDRRLRISQKPQVFHFAYRQPSFFGNRWLQYGCVIRRVRSVSLWHINGHAETLTVDSLTEPTPVKTYFGPEPAQFRVASLHPFQVRVTRHTIEPAVMFPG